MLFLNIMGMGFYGIRPVLLPLDDLALQLNLVIEGFDEFQQSSCFALHQTLIKLVLPGHD